MDGEPRTWHVERSSPVRADAEGLFVPVADLTGADVGDTVVVRGHDGGDERTGTIAERTEHDGDAYFRLDLRE